MHLATTLLQAGHRCVTSLESEQSGSGAHSQSPNAHSSPASSQAVVLVSEEVIVTICGEVEYSSVLCDSLVLLMLCSHLRPQEIKSGHVS